MAVEAEYTCNALLLDRNGQQQPGGLVDHFTNGGIQKDALNLISYEQGGAYTRKRGRAPMNIFSPPAQLPNHNRNVVSTGLGLSMTDQHHRMQHPNLFSKSSSSFESLLSQDFTNQINQQTHEIDQFLQAQGEQLRRTLAEKRINHYRALVGAAEESVGRRLREKEAKMEKARRRNAELEARAERLSGEAQAWQAKVRAQEATAAALQAQLQQVKTSGGGVEGQAEDAESACVDPDRVAESGPSCRACRGRVASVVVLPCRHMCLCTQCDRVAQACPLCLSIKNSTIQVFFS